MIGRDRSPCGSQIVVNAIDDHDYDGSGGGGGGESFFLFVRPSILSVHCFGFRCLL